MTDRALLACHISHKIPMVEITLTE